MKVTIKDIARECGVSVTAVSLAFSNKPNRQSQETKNKILAVAEKHHYQPNRAAVSLATRNSKWIGLIINDLRNTHIASLFMAVDRELQAGGYELICHVLNKDNDTSGCRMIQELVASNVAGIIWAKPYEDADGDIPAICEYIERIGLPVATMDAYSFQCPGVDVTFDYHEAGYLATSHLLELGHTRVGCVTGPLDFTVTRERLAGYRAALEESGIAYNEGLVYRGDYTMQSGSESLPYLLGQKATAIFSFNDEMAFGIYQSARQYGVKIPTGISVVGCDNVPFANVMEVPLSTVDVPVEEMGTVLGRELICAIENGEEASERRQLRYTPKLFLRGSTIRK